MIKLVEEKGSSEAVGGNIRGCDSGRQGDVWYNRLRVDRLCMCVAVMIVGRLDGMVRMVW